MGAEDTNICQDFTAAIIQASLDRHARAMARIKSCEVQNNRPHNLESRSEIPNYETD